MRKEISAAASLWLAGSVLLAGTNDVSVDVRAPESYVPNVPFLVRVDLRDGGGRIDRGIWDALATLSADPPSAVLAPGSVSLRNGSGSALVSVGGSDDFTLTVSVFGRETSHPMRSLAGRAMTNVGGTLPGASTTWTGIVHVTSSVRVPTNRTLTVEAGTWVLLNGTNAGSGGVSIDVEGTLLALGTSAKPISMTCYNPGLEWGQIHHLNSSTSRYEHTFISRAGRAPGMGHTGAGPAVLCDHSRIVFEQSCITDLAPGKIGYGEGGSDLTFRDCHLARAVMGPEIMNTAILVENTWLTDMYGADDSDAIYLHSAGAGRSMILRDSVLGFTGDDGIDMLYGSASFTNCIVRGVFDKGISGFGSDVAMTGLLIVSNACGISTKHNDGGTARIVINSTTIAGNDAGIRAANNDGGLTERILYFVTNCIIEAGSPGSDPVQTVFDPQDIRIDYSAVGETWPGTSNISANPLFADPGRGDYRLMPVSPCVDAGTNLAWMTGAVDLDGHDRVAGRGVDMGAYEIRPGALACYVTATPAEAFIGSNVVFAGYAYGTNTAGVSYRWDLNGDGAAELEGPGLAGVTHAYTNAGLYAVTLTVSNLAGETATTRLPRDVRAGPAVACVSRSGEHKAPYTNWTDAATNIQAAIDAGVAGTEIRVTSGLYRVSSEITVPRGMAIRSTGGAASAVVDAGRSGRCFRLAHIDALLEGFTITGGDSGAAPGGGIYIDRGGTVQNCTIISNTAGTDGGGVYCYAGGAVRACTLSGNSSGRNGGGVAGYYGGVAESCLVISNQASGQGGGIYYYNAGTTEGVYSSSPHELVNCTLSGNSAGTAGGGLYCAGEVSVPNTISYFNGAAGSNDFFNADALPVYVNCCTRLAAPGTGNITDDPQFVSRADGDYHLRDASPCIDSGTNMDWMTGAADVDGRPRIAGGTVDRGAHESRPVSLACSLSAGAAEVFAGTPVIIMARVHGTNVADIVYLWDLDDDGTWDLQGGGLGVVTTTCPRVGVQVVALRVSNGAGDTAAARLSPGIWVRPRVVYVSPSGQPTWPYTNWTEAATEIQAAVDAGVAGTLVLVTAGVYRLEAPLAINAAIVVRSTDGPSGTILDGGRSNRCVRLGHADAVLDGFTVTNGWTADKGGGAYLDRGGTVRNCRFTGNAAGADGGGVYCYAGGSVQNCVVDYNTSGVDGGGVVCFGAGLVENCLVITNVADDDGGGVYCDTLGAPVTPAPSEVRNCTIAGNKSADRGGGLYSRGAGSIWNTISYFNAAASGADFFNYAAIFSNCCMRALPLTNGNIIANPQFVNPTAGDYRLTAGSPCVDTGLNMPWTVGAADLDGHRRMAGGRVDMGAYEFQPEDTDHDGIADAWERQHSGALTNMTATSDSDGDRFPDSDEYLAGTDPTNPQSLLILDAPEPSATATDLMQIRWQSESNRFYRLDRSTSPVDAFRVLTNRIPASPPTNTCIDEVPGVSSRFYRVGVEL